MMKNIPEYYHDFIKEYASWYRFNWVYVNIKKPKNTPGLYLIVLNDHNKPELEILYIGSSMKLKQRISGHPILRLANEVYKITLDDFHIGIYYSEINKHNIADLKLIESLMIRKIRPRFNINTY
jgi:excinuclease UvrABC nuclease subunit